MRLPPRAEERTKQMARLNQIIAVEKGVKSRSLQELTEAHHVLQKPAQLAGIARTSGPKMRKASSSRPKRPACR